MLADRLVEALHRHPGSTASDLAGILTSAGTRVDAGAVTVALYGAHGRFRAERCQPEIWHLVDSARRLAAAPVARAEGLGGLAGARPGPPLYDWQAGALAAWARRGHRGVVEAVTGAGKTLVGVAAVAEQERSRGQSLVLVPTKELQQQWLAVLRERCAPATLVGALGDGARATLASHDVVVAVVNSVRATDVRPTRPAGLLVADECHRYGSQFNRQALDARLTRRLGLSATYARDDDGHREWLDPYFGGTCFVLGYAQAAAGGVIARPSVGLVGVALRAGERADYEALSDVLRRAAAVLIGRHGVTGRPYATFMREVNALADRGGDDEAALQARRYRGAVLERRRLLADAQGKLERLAELAPAVQAADRTIVFTQSIAASEAAASMLTRCGLRAGAVHSGVRAEDRRALLRDFAAGDLRALAAPRVLDEGVDVPAADLAVIMGASRTRRQMVQRMGRVLRVKPDGRLARFAVLFAEHTVEDPATGAHEGFLDEVTAVAAAVRQLPSDTPPAEVNAFLSTR